MNQINPLHVGALLVTVLLFMFFKLSSYQKELVAIQTEYKQSSKVATQLSTLDDIYANSTKIKSSLERLLRQPSLKSAEIKTSVGKNSYKISSDAISAAALNSLMGKILNGSYNVTALSIKKISQEKAKLEMEIKW